MTRDGSTADHEMVDLRTEAGNDMVDEVCAAEHG